MKSTCLLALVAVLVALQALDVSAGPKKWFKNKIPKLAKSIKAPKIRGDADRVTEVLSETKQKLAANREAADTTDRDKNVFKSFIIAVDASYAAQSENIVDAGDELENSMKSVLEREIRRVYRMTPESIDSKTEACQNEEAKEELSLIASDLEDSIFKCSEDLGASLEKKQNDFKAIGRRISELKAEMSFCVGDLTFAGHHLERRGAGSVLSTVLFNELAGIGLGFATDQIDNLINPRVPSCVPPEILREVALMPRQVDELVMEIKLLLKRVKSNKEAQKCVQEAVAQNTKAQITKWLEQCNE